MLVLCWSYEHYNDAILGAMASQITSLTIVYSTIYVQIKENIKASHHWPLWGEFTGDWWIPRTQMARYAENVSIWWRHHEILYCLFQVCTQVLELPKGVQVVHATVAAGHLSSSSIYPACFAPYLLTTACTDGQVSWMLLPKWMCNIFIIFFKYSQ